MEKRFSPRAVRALVAVFSISIAAGSVLIAAPALAQQCPSLIWSDEFDGSALDLSKWDIQIGDGCDQGICGWGNNELEYYKAENVTVSGGTLRITAREERVRSKKYTSGRIRTLGSGEWSVGRFEARLRLPQGQGIWPAFWMLPTDEVFGGWPASGEIDIMENIGSEPDTVHGTIHYGGSPSTHQQSGTGFSLSAGIFADAFHDFAIEKEPGVIRWFVDGVLYFTRTPGDIAPENWPFDERFHFLLNLAVGGNWPGSPDNTTVFPQVLEADYVRVYDGNMPHISGPRRVDHMATGTVFSVGNPFAGSSFTWSVPPGATIVSGQGTDSITVDWGTDGGSVVADVASACGARQLSIDVTVDPAYAFDFTFENFDEPATVFFATATGTLAEIANPAPSGINTSALSGEYTRNAGEQFDTLFYDVSVIADASAYESEQKRFYLDLYAAVAPGTQILIQLEDSASATSSNYPTGRHSRYQAFTSAQNQWQRLAFVYLDSPDPGTADGAIDDLVILFAPGSFTGDSYVFDHFDSYAVAGGMATTMYVQSIVEGAQSAGQGSKHATATVTLVDDLGSPVGTATVSGTFSGDFAETAAAATGPDGTATLVTAGTKKGGLTFTFCVDSVTHASLTYDPAANLQTCS